LRIISCGGKETAPSGRVLLIRPLNLSIKPSLTIRLQIDPASCYPMCTSIVNTKAMNAQACCERLWKAAGASSAESLIKDDFTYLNNFIGIEKWEEIKILSYLIFY